MPSIPLLRIIPLLGVAAFAAAFASQTPPVPRGRLVPAATLASRLQLVPRANDQREATLKSLFLEAGCPQIREQRVPRQNVPNLICTVRGSLGSDILVGAHTDKVDSSDGVVDNWSGAAALASLIESLPPAPRHTFIVIGFSAEEVGLRGSAYYAAHMSRTERARARAMINLDTLALGPTQVWLTHSDKHLAQEFYDVAQELHLPMGIVNADLVGDDDSSSFRPLKIPTLMVHSITQQTFGILHTPRDNLGTAHLADYDATYRLLAVYLSVLDRTLN